MTSLFAPRGFPQTGIARYHCPDKIGAGCPDFPPRCYIGAIAQLTLIKMYSKKEQLPCKKSQVLTIITPDMLVILNYTPYSYYCQPLIKYKHKM